jgi:hypothetical protein
LIFGSAWEGNWTYNLYGCKIICTKLTDAIDKIAYGNAVKAYNTIFYNSTGFEMSTSGAPNENCCFYNFGTPTGVDNIYVNPKMIDPEFSSLTEFDDWQTAFALQMNSPCIGAGVAI